MTERMTATGANGEKLEFIDGNWIPIPEETSTLDAVMLGGGAELMSLGRGAADLGAQLFEDIDPEATQKFRDDLAFEEQFAGETFSRIEREQPIAFGGGRILPYAATGGAAGGIRSIPALMALEGVQGGLKYGSPAERFQNALIASGGVGVGGMALRTAQGISRQAARIRGNRADIPGEAGAITHAPGAGEPVELGGGSAGAAGVGGGAQRGSAAAELAATDQMQSLDNIVSRQMGKKHKISPEDRSALKAGVESGITFLPSNATRNRAGSIIEDSLQTNPLTADIVQEVNQANNQLLNERTLDAMGVVTPPGQTAEFGAFTISDMVEQAGELVDDIKKRTPNIDVTDEAIADIKIARDGFRRKFTTTTKNDKTVQQIDNLIDDLEDSGTMTTDEYTKARSDFRKEQLSTSNQNEADAIGETIEALDKMFANTVGVEDFKQFQLATQRFRLAKVLEKPGVINYETGDVRAPALARNMKKVFKSEYGTRDKFGTFDDMPEMKQLFNDTRVYERFPKIIGEPGGSPTASRQAIRNILGDTVGSAATLAARPLARMWIKNGQPTLEQLK